MKEERDNELLERIKHRAEMLLHPELSNISENDVEKLSSENFNDALGEIGDDIDEVKDESNDNVRYKHVKLITEIEQPTLFS